MTRWGRLVGLALLITSSLQAQVKSITFKTDAEVLWAGVDRAGDLMLVLANGEVQKFDKTGKKIGAHAFKKPPTLLDPMDGVQSFYFDQHEIRFGNISYDLTEVTTRAIDPSFAIRPWLVCPSLHELWILDSADFTIKKTRMSATTISLEATLQHVPQKRITDYVHMREYQNYVFLLDKNTGVHMFNQLGKRIKTMGQKDMKYFNFLGEELYYLSGKELVFIDLYTNEKRSMTLPTDCSFILLTDDRQYAVCPNTISITEFRP